MCNFDGDILKAIGKNLVKYPGARTQHQVSKLTYQAEYKLCESRNLYALAAQLQHSHPHIFEKYNTKKCFLNSTTNVNNKFDQGTTT